MAEEKSTPRSSRLVAPRSPGHELLYKFKSDSRWRPHLTPAGADMPIIVYVDYGVEKDGTLSGVMTKVENGNDKRPRRATSSRSRSRSQGDADRQRLKGVEGNEIKQLVEGEYKKQTD